MKSRAAVAWEAGKPLSIEEVEVQGPKKGEVLVRNAFDTRYIPLAFPYPNFAPSGFMGEMGAPRTVSVSASVRF